MLREFMPVGDGVEESSAEAFGPSLRAVIGVLLLSLAGMLALRWLGRLAPVVLLGAGGLTASGQLGSDSSLGFWLDSSGGFSFAATLIASGVLALGVQRAMPRLEAWRSGRRRTSRLAPGSE